MNKKEKPQLEKKSKQKRLISKTQKAPSQKSSEVTDSKKVNHSKSSLILNKIKKIFKFEAITKKLRFDKTYLPLWVFNLLMLAISGIFSFLHHPFYIEFQHITDFFIVTAVTGIALILGILYESYYLYKKNKGFNISEQLIMLACLLVPFLSFLVILLVPLYLLRFIVIKTKNPPFKTRKKIAIISGVSTFAASGLLLPLIGVGFLLVNGSASSLKADETQSFAITNGKGISKFIPAYEKLNIVSWNIGYGATGSEMAYFYSKNNVTKKSGPDGKPKSAKQVDTHMDGIKEFLGKAVKQKEGERVLNYPKDMEGNITKEPIILPNVDFGFIQEIDYDSDRSFRRDELTEIKKIMPNYDIQFVHNYKNNWVPVPWWDPMGKVHAGLLTFSKYAINKNTAKRISLGSAGKGLDGIFNLKRAINYIDFKTNNSKTLHLLNVHLSAFDNEENKRKKEYSKIAELIKKWTDNNDYIIIGGDWNTKVTEVPLVGNWVEKIAFPDTFKTFLKKNKDSIQIAVDANFDHPTNRSTGEPWTGTEKSGNNLSTTSIIDYYLVSSNVHFNPVQTIQQGWHPNPYNKKHPFSFADSDHNPVLMQFWLS